MCENIIQLFAKLRKRTLRSKKLSSLMTCTKPLILSRKNLKNLEEILKEKEEEIKLLEK